MVVGAAEVGDGAAVVGAAEVGDGAAVVGAAEVVVDGNVVDGASVAELGSSLPLVQPATNNTATAKTSNPRTAED